MARVGWSVVLVAAAGCGAPQHGGTGASGPGACTLKGAWVITISDATDPCGIAAPGKAATLKFRTTGIGAVIDGEPPLAGFSMTESGADCRYLLHADKTKGAPEWAEFTLQVDPGSGHVSGEGHTDVAMSDGRVCSVPHGVTGTKR